MLSAERERELLLAFHADQSKAAMDELVRSHMPIIFRAASRSARNQDVDINDLVMTATEGLLIAINRWSFEKSEASGLRLSAEIAMERAENGETVTEEASEERSLPALARGSRLATYAMWWMRILLTDSVIESRGMVVRAKNPKTRKALFNMPAAIRTLDIRLPLTGHDVTRLSAYLGIGPREIEEALIHAAGDVMLDEPVGDGSTLRGDMLSDQRIEGEDGILNRLTSTERWSAVCEAMMALSPRDRFILITRYLLNQKWKLDRLSKVLGMSRERIRQIGDVSLNQIRLKSATIGNSGRPNAGAAVSELETLVDAIDRISGAAEPGQLSAFLVKHNIATGPSRVVQRRTPVVGLSVTKSVAPHLASITQSSQAA